MKGRAGLALTVAAVLVAGITPSLPAESSPVASTANIDWGRCANHELRKAGAECGFLGVPLDYANPSASTIQLAVSRLLHTSPDSKYQGVMLMNTGGPGIPGRDNSLFAGSFPDHIAAQYDWIGLDPRGVGESIPSLSCDPNYFVGPRPPYSPTSANIAHRWLKKARDYEQACASSPGAELLPYDSTIDWARDLESVRIALGVQAINFYGFSYGTYLGQVYATMFPSHVRRMLLDSNIDPRHDGLFVMLSMAKPVQRNLNFWFKWIARHHENYHLGDKASTVRHRFFRAEKTVTRHPAGGVVGQAEWVDIFFLTGFTNPGFFWPYLADVFSKWVLHHKSRPLVDAYGYFAEDTTSDSSYATFVAVRCMDSTWPQPWQRWRERAAKTSQQYPLIAWGNAWYVMPCRTWPASVASRVDVDGHGVRALILDDQFDGSIRFAADLAVRQRFPHSSLIEVRGGIAHTDSFANPCEFHYVRRYLAKGTLPPRRAGRGADALCSPDPRPTP